MECRGSAGSPLSRSFLISDPDALSGSSKSSPTGAHRRGSESRVWTGSEDARLRELVITHTFQHGTRWSRIAENMPGKSRNACLVRWKNHLNCGPGKPAPWTINDTKKLRSLVHEHGNKWVTIARAFPNRNGEFLRKK